jgi:O-antigen/teichoic acid export membrane protein
MLIGFAGIAASLCLTIDQLMVKKILDTYQLGLYSAATKVAFVVLTFLWIYAYALFPRLSLTTA